MLECPSRLATLAIDNRSLRPKSVRTAQNSYGGNTTGYVMSTYHKDSSKYEIDGYTYTLTMSEVSKYDQDADWQKFTIYLIKSCQENNKKIGSIDIKKLNRKIKNNL